MTQFVAIGLVLLWVAATVAFLLGVWYVTRTNKRADLLTRISDRRIEKLNRANMLETYAKNCHFEAPKKRRQPSLWWGPRR